MSDKKLLNAAQLSAIIHGTGPLLVIAGAGTGKTTVITERVKYLIEQKLASPNEILCLTFTDKAAVEMETRIDQALPLGYSQLWVTTFHSFCDRLMRDEALAIGLDPGFKLHSEADSLTLLEQHLFTLPLDYYRPLGNPQKFLSGLLQHISRLKDEDITPAQYLSWTDSVADPEEKSRYQELAQLYLAYEDLKIQNSVMDFSDLISHALALFRTRPAILKIYQSKFKYILVDEYQDTNYSQNILVSYLAGDDQNLTVVADDDQAIYRWRGAAVSNVIQFRTSYPTTKLVVLTQNYRSTQTILDSAYQLIQHNNPDRLEVQEHVDKHLQSTRGMIGGAVGFLHAKSVEQEADLVTKKIQELLSSNAYSLLPKDIAILVRANAHAEPFIKSFSYSGIPFQFLGPAKLFHQNEVRDLVAYLQVLDNYSNNVAMYRVLSQPYFSLPGRDLATITTLAKSANLTLFEASEILLEKLPIPTGVTPPLLSPSGLSSLTSLFDQLHLHLSQISRKSAGIILYDFMSTTGILSAIMEFKEPFSQSVSENIIRLFDKIRTYESAHSQALLPEVVRWLDLASELGDSSASSDLDRVTEDAVNILTIHAAKGLEFPVVFVVNLVSQRFPTISRQEQIPIPDALIKEILPTGDFHLQEERRLCYVALTRARDHLFLTTADFYGDGKRQKKPSPFISETLGNLASVSPAPSVTQMSLLDYAPSSQASNSTKPATPPPSITYLSYSQIQTFEVCPLHYKAKYILGIPTSASAASSFGNTMHLTLKDFYIQLTRLSTIPSLPNLIKQIHAIYTKSWTPVGYDTKQHADLYFQKGLHYLTDFIKQNFNPSQLPFAVEYPFSLHITSADGSRQLKIGGKIDRIDVLPGGEVEIIDYKTSATELDQKAADQSLQLSFYALVATSLPTPPFPCSPDQLKLRLHYFETGTNVSTTRSFLQLEAAKAEIFASADAIASSDFKCSGSPLCRKCDFHILCNAKS